VDPQASNSSSSQVLHTAVLAAWCSLQGHHRALQGLMGQQGVLLVAATAQHTTSRVGRARRTLLSLQ
jgi:hypothetical protein